MFENLIGKAFIQTHGRILNAQQHADPCFLEPCLLRPADQARHDGKNTESAFCPLCKKGLLPGHTVTKNKESLLGISPIQKRAQKVPIVLSEHAAVAAVVEAAARDDNREAIRRQFRELFPKRLLGVCFLGSLPENAGVLFRLFKQCAIISRLFMQE